MRSRSSRSPLRIRPGVRGVGLTILLLTAFARPGDYYFGIAAADASADASRHFPMTFSGDSSYVVLPQWVATTEGLFTLRFRTSEPEGLLAYMDSDGESGQHYLLLELFSGKLRVMASLSSSPADKLQAELGSDLNDDQFHTVLVKHTSRRFVIQLDGGEMTDSTTEGGAGSSTGTSSATKDLSSDNNIVIFNYSSGLTFETRTHVYMGGIPQESSTASPSPPSSSPSSSSSSPPFPSSTSSRDLPGVVNRSGFAGCLSDVEFLNASSFLPNLKQVAPLRLSGVSDGCLSPCEQQELTLREEEEDASNSSTATPFPCGDGVCVSRWIDGGSWSCSCRDTFKSGVTCAEGIK